MHGDSYAESLMATAEAKNAALKQDRITERVKAACFIFAEGKNAEERKSNAIVHPDYQKQVDADVEAQSKYNLARAKSDGLYVKFEAWRTLESTKRAEMKLV